MAFLIARIVTLILNILGVVSLLPTIFLLPAIIILVIIGARKNNYAHLKTYLKIWGISLVVFFVVLTLYAISSFVAVQLIG